MGTNTENNMERCVHGQESPCGCACPFSLNTRDFMEKLQRGSFGAAFNAYRAAVLFPDIVWRVCKAPCRAACAGAVAGEALALPLLEQAAIAYARSTDPVNYSMPEKPQRIAVVGAGMSGLACALKLAAVNYGVTVFEQTEQLGGGVLALVSAGIAEPEIRRQFQFTRCEFRLGTRVEDASALDFDAVFVSSGADTRGGEGGKVFRCAPGLDPAGGIVAGIRAADGIDWFLKTGSRRPAAPVAAKHAAEARFEGGGTQAVRPENGESYSKAEARQEAARCTLCDCAACMKECVLLRQYGSTPQDLAKDVGLSLNLFPETQGRAAMREIGSCNFCGLCRKICPVGVDIGAFLLRSRIELCTKGLLPQAHHEYWLRDMAFANSDEAALFYRPTAASCRYLFFPGCQSGGSDPRYVSVTYARLLEKYPDTALLLRCCGAPALWAGDEKALAAEHAGIRAAWETAGKPTVAVSCPSCFRIFRDYLPDIPVTTVYELLDPPQGAALPFAAAAVFDPCSSRDDPAMQQAVRRLAAAAGVQLSELPYAGEKAQCCSWGGQGYKVNPLFVRTLAKEQTELSDLPYITYCTNCRDIFSARGKDCRHILDLLCGINTAPRETPTASERRGNRRALRRTLIETYGIDAPMPAKEPPMKLTMDKAVAQKMSEDLILEEDLAAVIAAAGKTGEYLRNPEKDSCVAHLQLGYITYWVEYRQAADGSCEILNAYSHRMSIKGEYGDAE